MAEEIKPVNQPGFMAPIVPDYSGSNGTIPVGNRELDAYALMEKRLSAIGKPPAETFTELPATTLPGTGRYEKIFPGEDNEEIYAQGQTWGSKMVNSLGKGLALTGTTLLQSTVGLANGIYQSFADGRAASFYDNDFNRNLDEFNKQLEDTWANYYTQKEKNAEWYSPDKLFTANFFWDGIIKNMGFAAGAAISGYGYAAGLKALSSLPKMSRLFSVGKAAETLAATEEAILTTGKAAETYGKVKSLSDKFLGTYNSLNKGQRILVSGLSTTGEAGFEAYQNLNEFRNKKIQEYKDANGGLVPTGADLDEINSNAESVGNASFLGNVGLLTFTNYVQFPKILGSSTKLEKGILDQTVKEIGDITKDVAGKYIATPAKYGKVFGAINKIRPYLFSASEAFEEGAQFAIGKATNDYYDKKQKGDDASFMDSLTDAIASTIGTSEGMENVLIGGLSGAIMQGKGTYSERAEKKLNTQEAVRLFNQSAISNFTKETRDAVSRGVVLQEEREKKLSAGDTFGSKNSEFDYIINYLTPRIKYGRMDLVQSDIDEYRFLASTDKGFEQLIAEGKALEGEKREAYLERLSGLEATAENVKSLYQSLTLRYGNKVLPDGKTPMYNDEVMNKMIYAASKVADYDNRIPQLSIELSKAGIDSNSIIEDVLNNSDEQFNAAVAKIDSLKNSVTNPLNDDQILDLQSALIDLTKGSIERKKFIDEYNEIKKSPDKFTAPALTEDEKKIIAEQAAAIASGQPAPKKAVIKVKTKDGEEDLEVGTEYFLGRVVEKDKNNNDVYRAPKLTILGENEDGTIKIKDSNGLVRDVSKNVLADYKLGKVSDTLANKKAKFFMDHWNTVYEFNFGKGKKVKGRLEYSHKDKVLKFVYLNNKRQRKELEVTGDQFVARKGYANPMIKAVGELTVAQKKAMDEFVAEKDERTTAKRESRLKILSDLFDEVSNKLDSTKSLLQQKYSQFEKIINDLAKLQEQIKVGELTKTNTFKKTTNNAIKAANRLSRMQEQLRIEIAELEAERDQLEINQAYIFDLSENIDELPTDSKEFLEELKDQRDAVADLVLESGLTINSLSKLLDNVEGALKTAVDFALDLIKKFEAKYPNLPYTPLGLREFLNKDLEFKGVYPDYQSYLQANPNLLSDLTEFERDIAEIDELDVIPNERSVAELKDEIEKLYVKINEAEQQLKAKNLVLDRLENIAAAYKKQQEEEAAIARNNKLREEWLGVNTEDVQTLTAEDNQGYEAASKKGYFAVVGGTSPINVGKAHQIRANNFGVRLPKIDPDGDEIFGIVVTQNTEEELKLGGLMKHLYAKDPTTVIALVMVRKNKDGTYSLVDEFGEIIPPGSDMINTAIYQVFPEKKLTANYGSGEESMFRKNTPEGIVKALSEQFGKWRDARLAETKLGNARKINASFGVPDYVKHIKPDGKEGPIDYAARTSAVDSGLISKSDLVEDQVMIIATTNKAVGNGSVTFDTPLGRVFLKVPGGLVKLFNRKFNKKEAETIFDVIHQVAKNAVDDKTIKSERTQLLFNWLKSVTYWGIAKNTQTGERKPAGYNNIWFEDVPDEKGVITTRLFISGKNGSIPFTPSSLENNKADIIGLLQNMYFNANATLTRENSYNKPYQEIVGIKKDGTPEYKRWDNYQTFLLSSEGRTKEEVPFTTVLKPQIDPDAINRKDVYFTLRDVADDYVLPEAAPVVTQAPVVTAAPTVTAPVATATAPVVTAKPAEQKAAAPGVYDLNGETPNFLPLINDLGSIWFTADIKTYDPKTGSISIGFEAADDATSKKLLAAFGTEDEVNEILAGTILAKIQPQLEASLIPVETPFTPIVTAPVVETKTETSVVSDDVKTPIEGLNERLDGYGNAKVVLPSDFYEGARPTGRLNAFKSSMSTVADNLIVLADLNLNEFDFLSEEDKKRLDALRPLARELREINTNNISSAETRTVAVEKRYAQLTNQLTNEFIDIVGKHVEQQLGKSISSSKPRLAALGTKPTAETKVEDAPSDTSSWGRRSRNNPGDEVFRLEILNQLNKFEGENWTKLESWLKANFPNLPVYRVKNAIQATNGRQAWGMLHKGSIYIYENAEVGTAYHEVFEAVWKMFSDAKERKAILDEFKKREGSYYDVFSGKTIKYSEATPQDIKEKLAEEFRDYVLTNKNVAKPTYGKSLISRLFAELVNCIRELFYGPKAQTNTANLFAKIGNGYYRDYVPYESPLSFAQNGIIDIDEARGDAGSDFRLDNIPAVQQHEIMQQMTYSTLAALSKTNADLFSVPNLKRSELYDRLKEEVLSLLHWKGSYYEDIIKDKQISDKIKAKATTDLNSIKFLYSNVETDWKDIVEKHEEHLKTFSIEFDENDDIDITSEEKGKDSPYGDSRKIDGFRKANSAIKLLVGTLPVMEMTADGPKPKRTSIGGVLLMPSDKVFVTLMNTLHTSINLEEMIERLKVLAEGDPGYTTLYRRIMKPKPNENGINYNMLNNDYDLQLLTSFFRTFKKQSADVRIVFVLPSGDVVIGDSTLASAAKQARMEMTNTMIKSIKSGTSYLKYDEKEKLYQPQAGLKRIELDPARLDGYTEFLKTLGVEFDPKEIRKMSDNQVNTFRDATQGILKSMIEATNVATLNAKTLDIDGQLLKLGAIKAILEKPEFESTYFNLNGERAQTAIGTNAASDLYDVLFKIDSINDLKNDPAYAQYKYLTTDKFAIGSNLLNRMFNIGDPKGKRRKNTEGLLKTAYVDGTVNEESGKKKESSKLNLKERIIQEMNLNLDGYYMHLVPGDASIEWMSKLGNAITDDMLAGDSYEEVYRIFKEYFMSEVELSREDRPIVQDEGNTRSSRDLRFFKNILGDKLHKSIIAKSNDKLTPKELYESKEYKADIERAIKAFILKETEKTEESLRKYGIIFETEEGTAVENLSFSKETTISKEDLTRHLKTMTVNYMIANIELHKIIYSDPYQYKDELKRIKNFLSPRTPLVANSPEINKALDRTYNKDFQEKDAKGKNDIGYTDFIRDYFRSITLADVTAFSDLFGYKPYKETDGGGIITMKANRNFRLRNGQWNADEEKQYKFDVKFEKFVKSGASKEAIDKFLEKNPGVMSAYTPLKPIVSGNKGNGRTYNDILLDKFALVPQSYRILYQINPTSNAIKLYDKMQAEDIDYAVFASGRKVGAEKIHNVYDGNKFNEAPFETPGEKLTPDKPQGVTNVPYSIVSVQSEVPSKEAAYVTQGSQITKLATMDFMEAGVPVDFEIKDAKGNVITNFDDRFIAWMELDENQRMKSELYKEIKRNQELLEAKIEEGFTSLIKELGIVQTETTIIDPETNQERVVKSFTIEDKDKLANTLKGEILKREVNDNITEAFDGFKDGDVVLEATPAYQQIRNVLYSIADKRVISPKITGGQKVQIPSSFLESERIYKSEKGAYQNDLLKFYKNANGERVCEIMVGRWFKSDMTDEDLLEYLNNTDEGKKILAGVGFRIPTQKQNSIDVFKIAKFLPKEAGDSVVIPSELVQKSGSDFDIDKLSLYFKNTYVDAKGKLKLVPYFGIGNDAKNKYEPIFFDILQSKIDKAEAKVISQSRLQELFGDIVLDNAKEKTKNKWIPLFRKFFSEEVIDEKLNVRNVEDIFMARLQRVGKKLNELTDYDLQQILLEDFMDKMYKESLENEYIQSLENLISHPLNFDNLVKPNSAKQLEDLAKDINKKLGRPETDYSSTGNMLSRTFMTELRQAFVSGKYAIGIAATAQTLQAQFQRFSGYIDYDKLDDMSDADKKWLGDGKIKFTEFNSVTVPGKGKLPSLSMIKNKAGNYITDIIGQFIDGYVDIAKGPWIMQLGATPNVASTWLFLAKVGVPIKTVAYFMNQPIVRDYLNEIESNGYSYLFIDKFFNNLQDAYDPGATIGVSELPNETDLGNMVGVAFKDLKPVQKAQQQFILKEFVKYAKLSEHMFQVTQGSNFDTATINDPYLVFKKIMQLKKARNTMISSVDDVLDNSFVGILKDRIYDIRDAFATVLTSDKKSVRNVIEAVLTPFIDTNDRDFIKLAQKAVNDLFDWAVQTDRKFNMEIEEILLGKDNVKSASAQIMDLQKKVLGDKTHPLFNNMIIRSIREKPGQKEGAPNNLSFIDKYTKVYDQNLIIYSFRELKNHLGTEGNDLYKKLVRLAVIQSGLTNSPIAFTALLPYEDFKEEYNATLANLENMPNLAEFQTLGVFQRNNWSNSTIVDSSKAKWKKSKKGNWYSKPHAPSEMTFLDNKLQNAISRGMIPQLLNFSTLSSEGRSEFLVFSWEKAEFSKDQKKEMRKKGNYSYINKGLFKKVYDREGNPLIQTSTSKDGVVYKSFVYKAINAWGDSFRANEFYTTPTASKLENGFVKVKEVEDVIIDDILNKAAVPMPPQVIPTGVQTKPVQTTPAPAKTANNAKVLEGDIFALPGIPVITTNLGGVHGAGLAQVAKSKGLIKQGDGKFKATDTVVQLPVKKIWSDSMAMNNNMELLKESLRSLIKTAKSNSTKTYLLPLAGLGHGEGSIEEILPLLIKTIQASPNIKLVLPAQDVNLGRQGTVRKDYTRENMPKIKAMLSQSGLTSTQPISNKDVVNALNKNNTIDKKCNS